LEAISPVIVSIGCCLWHPPCKYHLLWALLTGELYITNISIEWQPAVQMVCWEHCYHWIQAVKITF